MRYADRLHHKCGAGSSAQHVAGHPLGALSDMITKLTLRNFKGVGEQVYEFTRFDLLVGRNNSGKSTVLQAMAIWQFCVDEFHRSKRTGTTGIQVVLPNFSALPVPEFILLW